MSQQLTPSADLPTLVEGDDYTFAVSFSDRSGAAIDITDWTVSMTIADQQTSGGTPIVERDITTHDDATGGKTSWDLPGSETAGTTGTKRYDIQVVKSDGTTRTVALGTVGFLDGATDRAISGGGGSGVGASTGAAIDVTLDGDDSISLSIQGLTNYTDSDVLDAINGAAISPGEVFISGWPAGKALDQSNFSNITEHIGYQVSVPSSSYHDIFSTTNPVDVLNGNIIGDVSRDMMVTWDDGTTDTFYSGTARGENAAGTAVSTNPIPPMEDVTALRFINAAGASSVYGYKVITV